MLLYVILFYYVVLHYVVILFYYVALCYVILFYYAVLCYIMLYYFNMLLYVWYLCGPSWPVWVQHGGVYLPKAKLAASLAGQFFNCAGKHSAIYIIYSSCNLH